jgi:uncharacterized membrane protein YcaP (DUF421 family)
MSPNLVVFVRSVFAFITLFIYTRILGKQQLAQLNFFEYATGITIGSIAATMSTDLTSIGFHHFVGLTTWAVLVLIFQLITVRNRWLNKILVGEPTIVIQNGNILEKNLKITRYTYNDLMQQLRQKNVFSLTDVEFAILEPNGELSVLPKSQKRPVTPKDLSISTEYEGLSTELITDGKIIKQNLQQIHLDENWLMNELRSRGINDLSEVAFACIDSQGILYIDKVIDKITRANDPSDYEGPN